MTASSHGRASIALQNIQTLDELYSSYHKFPNGKGSETIKLTIDTSMVKSSFDNQETVTMLFQLTQGSFATESLFDQLYDNYPKFNPQHVDLMRDGKAYAIKQTIVEGELKIIPKITGGSVGGPLDEPRLYVRVPENASKKDILELFHLVTEGKTLIGLTRDISDALVDLVRGYDDIVVDRVSPEIDLPAGWYATYSARRVNVALKIRFHAYERESQSVLGTAA